MSAPFNDAASFEHLSLEESRNALSSGMSDGKTVRSVEAALGLGAEGGPVVSPLQNLRNVLEGIRNKPPGRNRIACMNSLVRTLGVPHNLALLLDLLRESQSTPDEPDAAIGLKASSGRMHCIYGWAGQTLLVGSLSSPTTGTVMPRDDMEFLGYPSPQWDLSIHIWQPNPEARGFESSKRVEANVIIEPPHSHPFDFVSYVSIGTMHQSIYRERESTIAFSTDDELQNDRQRYGGVVLERVDGIWPPHEEHHQRTLVTIEHRVLLRTGHSYFLPHHMIHDVEVDRESASQTPAITLFLPTEAVVKPRAYISPAMARYHEDNPDLKERGQPLALKQWQRKLDALASYLRGDSKTLRLGEIVRCGSDYGFMHV